MEEQKKEVRKFIIPENAPDAGLSMGLGIASIMANFIFPGFGLIFGIVGIIKSKSSEENYNANPVLYTKNSKDYIKVGKITSIIGIIFSILYFIAIALLIFVAILAETGSLRHYF